MSRTRAGDGEGEQDRYGYTRSAEKQKEDACKERVFPRLVQNGTKVVGKEGATGNTRFKILTLAGDLHEGCLRVPGEKVKLALVRAGSALAVEVQLAAARDEGQPPWARWDDRQLTLFRRDTYRFNFSNPPAGRLLS